MSYKSPDDKDSILAMMTALATADVWQKFNWKGQGTSGKTRISKWALVRLMKSKHFILKYVAWPFKMNFCVVFHTYVNNVGMWISSFKSSDPVPF